jgi:NSS family neurotransmitter:Na+ symporter
MAANLDASVDQRFSSRLGFLLSVIGIAVGTGNIWRFPRIVAQNGSDAGAGAFLVAWTVFLFLWSIPLVLAEYAMGRKCRMGVVGTVAQMAGEKFAWMGAFMAVVTAAITFFYAVVLGWCLYYFVQTLMYPLPLTTDVAMARWNDYQGSHWPLVTHATVVGIGAFAIWRGVQSIERVNRILIPTLLVIVLMSVVRGLTLPGAWAGVTYLFTPQWGQLSSPRIWMEALTQNAWDVGAGWGLYLTYAAYVKREHGVVKNGFITPIGNNLVSMLAALMVFATVFSVLRTEMGMVQSEVLEIMRTSGLASTGLTFIWMPQLFARMFLGRPLAILFFLGLTFAGFSSLIAHLELSTRVLIDAGLKRSRAIVIVTTVIYLLGVPSAISLNVLKNQDFVWGYALMISGALAALAVARYGASRLRNEELLGSEGDWGLGRWWDVVLVGFVPLGAMILLIWWLVKEAQPGTWYNPLDPTSVMNCLVQWAVVLTILLILGPWLARRSLRRGVLSTPKR